MKIIKHNWIIIITFLTFSSCLTNIEQAKNEIITLNINTEKFADHGVLSELIEPSELITLETNDNCLINQIQKVEIYGSNIYVLDWRSQKIFRFDLQGKYLGQMGKAGNGPGEYLEIHDFIIDTINSIFYIPDIFKVHAYTLNGEHIKSKRMKFMGPQMSLLNDNKFVFLGGGREDRILITDENFNLLNSNFPYSPAYAMNNIYTFSKYNNNTIFHLTSFDTLYSFIDGKPKPYFYMDFNGCNFTEANFNDLSEKDKKNISEYQSNSGKYVRCLGFLPLHNTAFLLMNYANKAYSGYYNLGTGKYIFIEHKNIINDIFGAFIYMNPVGLTAKEFIFAIEPNDLIEDNSSEFYRKYSEKLNALNQYSNPVLLFAKPKI